MHVLQTPANVSVLTPYANLPYPTNSAGDYHFMYV